MGRTKTKKKPLVRGKPEESAQPSIPSLLQKTQELIIQSDYSLAQAFVQRILQRDPTNVEAKEMLGVVQLELGDLDAAKQTFISLLPPHVAVPPPSAYLYLAQLSDDEPRLALQHYQSAVDLLSSQLKGKDRALDGDVDDESDLQSNIVRALIGQVEIWMDPSYDLCDEAEAPTRCEELLTFALQVDPGNAEALQALASVRMSQERPDDAKSCLEQSWTAWKDLDIDHPKVPPIPSRLVLVRLFLEMSLFTPALLVLHGVMSSDDQEVEAWYLEGWCYFLMAEKAKEANGTLDDLTWAELAQDARDRLETCQLLHVNEDHPDIPMLEHTRELIGTLEAAGVKASPEGEPDGGGDWEDVESSDDEDVDMA